jgi:long-chain acyl-CoA synthetase
MSVVGSDKYGERPWARSYESGIPASLDYPETTLAEILTRTAAHFGNHPALLFYGASIRYSELESLAHRFASALLRLGVRKGQRVALMLPNIPQMVIAYYGTLRIGAVVVATNPLYREHELETQLRDSGAETLVVLDQFFPVASRVHAFATTQLKRIIVCGVRDYLPFPKNLLYPIKAMIEKQRVRVKRSPPVYDFIDIVHRENDDPIDAHITPDDIAALQYTGGTTGTPKGAVLTHRNLVVNAAQCRAWLSVRDEGVERLLAAIPFFHVYGMTTAMNLGVLIGAELVLVPRFHTKDVLHLIEKYRPGIFPGIQAMYVAINHFPGVEKYDLSSLKTAISGAGPLMHEVQEEFERLTKARIVEGYGLSEASPVTHANPIFGRRKVGTIGLPWPDTEARVVDIDTGNVVPVGSPGELVVKGPQVMNGYWNKPLETAHALQGGWLHTGDVAIMDDEGYFTIVDRIKDMIKTVGENVYPREVEEVLYAHPKVREAVVVGVPNEQYLGEKIKAFVVLKDGEHADADELIGFCREQLSKFKVPKEIEFRDQLPKTLVGKVLRRVLRDEELNKSNVPVAVK